MWAYLSERVGKCRSLKEALIVLSLAERSCTAHQLIYLGLNLWHVPLQVETTVQGILSYVFEELHVGTKCEISRLDGCLDLDVSDDRTIYPLKGHVAAETKVNVFFRDVWADAKRYFPEEAAWFAEASALTKGMYNDQASGWLTWYCAVARQDRSVADSILANWSDKEFIKTVSLLVKSLGATATRLGCCVAELKVT